ncbi:uncharacterized protein BDCG_03329 [Blastomyces dermatitidis ER-3]|uniref:Uncharacterized protein n=1 Tax=Ajellomyces dermatitidis (strain ER-3 / ATCC MYA-2586) TaxID=559297 RepID=A0ABP2EW19_AJEDR|nr:uncharacterized protein BDCG_03329 [Blastomyces dermatitidis ER-3]EEQ88209.2 hypothetical protein BDCG_03329 [Blastomyces dermatitidis ER-3]
MDTSPSRYEQHPSLLPEPEGMQNLPEGLLEAVRKAAETAELELKLRTRTRILNEIKALHTQWQAEVEAKQQLTFTVNQASTMKSFADAIAIINKDRENQILGLQQEIECLCRQVTMLNLEVPS